MAGEVQHKDMDDTDALGVAGNAWGVAADDEHEEV